MAQIRKFFFETCFDDPEEIPPAPAFTAAPRPGAAPAPPPPEPEIVEPPPPAITEEDLAAARGEGFAAGHAAGAEAERTAAARHQAQLLDGIAAQLGAIEQALGGIAEAAERRAVGVGLPVLRALVPELLRRHGIEEIEALLRESMSELIDEPRLVLRVPDKGLDLLKDRLPTVTARSGFAGRVILLAEDGMQDGDCRIEWADGGIERNAGRMLRQVEAAVARLLPDDTDTIPG